MVCRQPTTASCSHGRPAVCWARHEPDDTALGRPLCLDCYNHDHQVVWNIFSGELWHRTKQAAQRWLAKLARRRGIPHVEVVTATGRVRRVPPIRLSPGKVAELQARGAVHFHAIARLDGVNGQDPDTIVPPPTGITTTDLINALHHATEQIAFHTPTHPDRPEGWPITWGEQVDIHPITTDGAGEITDGMVAGYLAKYATKATGHTSTRLTTDSIGDYADPDGDHTARLIDACWRIGRPTTTPIPLSDRPRDPRPTPHFIDRWQCPTAAPTPATPPVRPASPTVKPPLTPNRRNQPAPTRTPGYADGHTCSATAATSSPKPAATPSPSGSYATPASPTAATNTTTKPTNTPARPTPPTTSTTTRP